MGHLDRTRAEWATVRRHSHHARGLLRPVSRSVQAGTSINGKHGRARAVRTAVAVGGGSSPLLHLALSAAARHGPSTRCAAPHQWTEPRGAIGLALLGGPPEPPPATLMSLSMTPSFTHASSASQVVTPVPATHRHPCSACWPHPDPLFRAISQLAISQTETECRSSRGVVRRDREIRAERSQ